MRGKGREHFIGRATIIFTLNLKAEAGFRVQMSNTTTTELIEAGLPTTVRNVSNTTVHFQAPVHAVAGSPSAPINSHETPPACARKKFMPDTVINIEFSPPLCKQSAMRPGKSN